MNKATLLLAGALMISPAMFAQQSSAPASSDQATSSQASTQSSTQAQSTSAKANLTADQKAELKDLKAKAKTACKADANSDACKQAKTDLHSKMSEYGVQGGHHKGHKGAATTSQNPS